jgi:hypothetical protein
MIKEEYMPDHIIMNNVNNMKAMSHSHIHNNQDGFS